MARQQRNDLEILYPESKGGPAPTQMNDTWFDYLRGLGCTGSLDDMKKQFWEGPPAAVFRNPQF